MITPLWQLLKGYQINNIIRSEESVFTDPKNKKLSHLISEIKT